MSSQATQAASITGSIVLGGGILGYVSKRSKPSLIAGTLIGLGLIGSGQLIYQGDKRGDYMATALGLVLALAMGRRASSGASVPLIMTGVGTFVTLYHGNRVYRGYA